jgi:membrane carboxypeptidase/penicillin-binding protein PbpC
VAAATAGAVGAAGAGGCRARRHAATRVSRPGARLAPPGALEEVSPRYIEALVAYEDRSFWWHPGVNPWALLRAAAQWLEQGRVVSGGSTLTMQVARLLEPTPRTLAGKLRQIARALQLELRCSKREILEIYLNFAPMGGVLEGVEAASRAYLGKPAQRLSAAEAALLTVLPQAPSRCGRTATRSARAWRARQGARTDGITLGSRSRRRCRCRNR